MESIFANSTDPDLPSYDEVSRLSVPRGKIKRYVYRKGVHIVLMEDGNLYVQGRGAVYQKVSVTNISSSKKTFLSGNIADIEGIYYYNYNGSPEDTFKLYGNDGKLILKSGNKQCVLL